MPENDYYEEPQAESYKVKFSLVWIIPIVVAIFAVYLGWKSFYNAGPTISVTFETADGIISGQTQIKNKSVVLGTVKGVSLSKDMHNVTVWIEMTRKAAPMITENARFWVVRPRFSGTNISGLETLISGAYIAFDPGDYKNGKREEHFVGLESPPGVRSDQPGTTFVLATDKLGSLGQGTPIFYRDTVAGEVLDYKMPANGIGPIRLNIFLKKPYDSYLHSNSSFWNVSGLKIGFGASGLNIEMQSIQALVSGGIAFGVLDHSQNLNHDSNFVPVNTEFKLYTDKEAAESARFRDNVKLVTYVTSSVKGLSKGSRITLFGLQVGTVQDISLQVNRKANKTRVKIIMDIQPERVFSLHENYDASFLWDTTKALIANGLKASIDNDNFLLGTSLISLNFVKTDTIITPSKEDGMLVIPSQTGGMDGIVNSMSAVTSKIAAMPLEEIGNHLDQLLMHTDQKMKSPDVKNTIKSIRISMQNLSELSKKLNKGSTPFLEQLPEINDQIQNTLKNANALLVSYGGDTDFHRNLQQLMVELNQTSRSLRFLSDFITQHPSALILGRKQ
ncbi:Intermembrane transport protein PqiB [Commensalibacter sp. Nvir]|uniref:PqiB family protein n=1 Tax=Commensalibacter sp. Nvir TaxID=3069817 RepID=UPI002D7000AC|nr:Intermembrane transport protein PqiB [Commensalibacter sp. Nvir]